MFEEFRNAISYLVSLKEVTGEGSALEKARHNSKKQTHGEADSRESV